MLLQAVTMSCRDHLASSCVVLQGIPLSGYHFKLLCGTHRALKLWRDTAHELQAERDAVKLQRAAMLCFGSYCQRAMGSWRHAVWLRRTLRRALESHEVVLLDQCAS